MYHYNSLSAIKSLAAEKFEYSDKIESFPMPSVTDKTQYRPTAEQARSGVLRPGTGSTHMHGLYDFPDGRDDGSRTFRQVGADPVEFAESYKRTVDGINTKIKVKREKDAKTADDNATISKIGRAIVDAAVSGGSNANNSD